MIIAPRLKRACTQRGRLPIAFSDALHQTCVCNAQERPESTLSISSPDAALKILVIDADPIRRAILDAGLRDAGFVNVILAENTTALLEQIYRIDPDLILIDLENPSRDVLEQMFQVSRIVRRPIAMFVDQS